MSAVFFTTAALVVVLGAALLHAFIARPLAVAASVLAMSVVHAYVGDIAGIPMFGIPLAATDGVFILVALAAVARLMRLRNWTSADRLLTMMSLVLLFSLIQGAVDFGGRAAREFRPFIEFFGPALYFSTVQPSPALLERLGRLWLGAVSALVLLATVRWVAIVTAFDLGMFAPTHVSANFALRVLDGRESFTVGQAFILALPAAVYRPWSRPLRVLVIVLGIAVILLNRRTVWVATLIGLVLLVARGPILRRIGARPLIVIAVVAGAVLTTLPQSTEAGAPVAESAVDAGTFWGRVEGFQYLLSEGPDGTDWLIGTPLGPGFERRQGGREVDSIPHSLYIFTLLRTGAVGLLILLALYAVVLTRVRKWPPSGILMSPWAVFALLIMQLVFFVTWIAPIEQGLILGLGCSFLRVAVPDIAQATPGVPSRVYG